MPDRKPDRPPAGTPRPPRARIPFALIGIVFAPLAGAYVGLLRNVEGFRFAHPYVLALIPLLVALVLWMELGVVAKRRALFLYSRATEVGAQRPGFFARLRDLPTVLRLAAAVRYLGGDRRGCRRPVR